MADHLDIDIRIPDSIILGKQQILLKTGGKKIQKILVNQQQMETIF